MLKQRYRMLLLLPLFFLGTVRNTGASSLVPQTNLPGICIPQFAVPLPVFGPAGAIPRVDTLFHNKITVRMREINQSVLPVGMHSLSGKGCPAPPSTFKKTRVWAYETSDTKNGKVLGPANWPAVTLEVNQLAQESLRPFVVLDVAGSVLEPPVTTVTPISSTQHHAIPGRVAAEGP